jgi:hypothetical protein
MSKRTLITVGAVILVLVVAGVILFTQLQSQQAMANGPGMLYFFSPV